jgi:FkbM family methyltransferase
VILDLGANVGAFPRWASQRWPQVKIICYEPNPDNFALLQRTVKEMLPNAKVETRHAAISDHYGEEPMYFGSFNCGEYSLIKMHDKATNLGLAPVLDAADLPTADMLKMDVEGYEFNILTRLKQVGRLGEFKAIVLEYHSAQYRDSIQSLLIAEGFRLQKHLVYSEHRGLLKYMRTSTYRPRSVAELCPNPDELPIKKLDVSGWNGTHPVFKRVIDEVKPSTIIEVGSWKGQGTLHLAECMPVGQIYAVDTWLGGSDHLWNGDPMPMQHGRPLLYEQFLFNVAASPHAHRIFPILQPSTSAAVLLNSLGYRAEVVIIDASHTYLDCYNDLCCYADLMAPGGVMVVDDVKTHPGVTVAVHRFRYEHNLKLELDGPFAVLRAP